MLQKTNHASYNHPNYLIRDGECMKGSINTKQKCPFCESKLVHDERKSGFFCPNHPEFQATKKFYVKFGKHINKQFKDYKLARQFLNGIRFKFVEKSFDPNDYRSDRPNSFDVLAEKYLNRKKNRKSFKHIENYIFAAVEYFGEMNVKDINGGDIEDFLFSIKGKSRGGNLLNRKQIEISEKTRANYKSALHDFFVYCKKREIISSIPNFPDIDFDLGYRNFTTLEIQQQMIDTMYEMNANPKVGFAFELLCRYPSLRPDDLRRVNESDYDLNTGHLFFKDPTKLKNSVKIIKLIPEHKEIMDRFILESNALPNMPIFRHTAEGVRFKNMIDKGFGRQYIYKQFLIVCKKLGIEGIDLYGATRHTTITAIAKLAGSDKAKKASGHLTNKAFERYCQAEDTTAFEMSKLVVKVAKEGKVINFKNKKNGDTEGTLAVKR